MAELHDYLIIAVKSKKNADDGIFPLEVVVIFVQFFESLILLFHKFFRLLIIINIAVECFEYLNIRRFGWEQNLS